MSRVTKEYGERYAEFLDTARELFFSQGYQQTTVQDIIDAVGVAKGTFYHYFDSKQGILAAVGAELAAEKLALFKAIVDDDTLDALEKWTRAARVVGGWRAERRKELRELVRVLQADENALLAHKLAYQQAVCAVPVYEKIIQQGIEEGVFRTPYVEDTAEIVYGMLTAVLTGLTDIFLNPDNYEHPTTLARRKLAAAQTAVERVLGAPPGSLPIAEEPILAPWFEK